MNATDTLRFRCEGAPVLLPRERDSIPFAVERLLTAGHDLLLVIKGGALFRIDGLNRDPVQILDGGKDYDARGDVVVRLAEQRLGFFYYDDGRLSPSEPSLAAASHDMSVAMGPSSLYLHSPANPANVLVVERDRRSGGTIAAFLPVERNFVRLLLSNADAILKDAGYVRAFDGGFVFVPMIRDPIQVVGKHSVTLFMAGGDRGEIRTVSKNTVRDDHPCPTCTHRREVETRQEVRRLYSDAVIEGEALWILRLAPPGSATAVLHRYPLGGAGASETRSWKLGGMESTPRAMTIWGERLVVADEHHLHFYEVPSLERGAACSLLP